jgi:hypothetical protein
MQACAEGRLAGSAGGQGYGPQTSQHRALMLACRSLVQAVLSSIGRIIVCVEPVGCGPHLHLCCITCLPRIVVEFPQTPELFEACAYHAAWLLFEISFMNSPRQGILRLPCMRLNGSCRMDSITAVTSWIAVARCTHWLLKLGSHHYIAADNNTGNPSLAADAGAGNTMGCRSTGCSCGCSAELEAAVVVVMPAAPTAWTYERDTPLFRPLYVASFSDGGYVGVHVG